MIRTCSDPRARVYLIRKTTPLFLFLIVFLLQPVSPVFSSQVVIDEIQIIPNDDNTTFNINFGLPLAYQKHFPRNIGEIVQIQLKLEEEEKGREIHKEVRDSGELLTPEGVKSDLVYVTYEEGVPGGPYLTLRFSHPVRFDIKPGTDRMSISVVVYKEKQKDEKGGTDKKDSKTTDLMMAKARQAITFGNNKGAIEVLRKILQSQDNEHTQEANELLGLALERDNQIPRAKYEYRKYLKKYPEGEGSTRVQQRLTALREIRATPKRKLRRSKETKARDKLMTFGRFTQAYSEYYVDRELTGLAEDTEQQLQQRLLSTNFSVKSRYRSDERTVLGVVNASHSYDYLAGTTGREDDDKEDADIRRMYIDIDDRVYNFVGLLGRQSSRNGGVFGTFDGVVAGYRISPRWLASVMAGKPVIRTYNDIDIYEKSFYGVKFDVTSDDKKFSNNVFFVQQNVDGVLDRQAIGGDIRYADKGLSIFGLFDYDLYYEDVSLFNIRVGWSYSKSNKLNFSFNRSQLYMTSNAIEGQSVFTIDELIKNDVSESELKRIAKEKTRSNDTLTIGNSYQISKDKQFNIDVTVLKSSGSPAGVDLINGNPIVEVEATGNQYLYSLQWISSNTFKERDLYVLGLRRSEFSSYADDSAFVNARIPVSVNWRSGVRMNLSRRDSNTYGKRVTVSPLLTLDYRLSKSWSFDVELGFDFVRNIEAPAGAVESPNEVRTRGRLAYNYTF